MTVLKKADERRLETPSSEESGLGNSEEDSPSTDDIANVIVPPDGGWGWVVVIGSFVANLLVDGICYSSGLLLAPIAQEFEVTLSRAALVSSLLTGCYLIAGPFVSALANRYGFRVVTVIGSIICGAAFGLSYFANSIDVLCFSYGIIGGLGLSMIYMPSVIVVGFYFERWRALATGISLCGSGVGTFVFGPLTDTLIRDYGWRSTVAIQGGLISICVLCGLTFRPIRPVTLTLDEIDEEGLKQLEEAPKRLSINAAIAAKEDSGLSLAFQLSKHHRNAAHTWMGVANNTEYPTAAEVFRNSQCNLHRRLSANAAMIKGPQTNSMNKPKYTVVPVTERDENSDETLAPNESTGNKDPLIRHLSFKLADPIEGKANRRTLQGNEPVVRPMYKDDIFFGGSLNRLPMYQSTTSVGYHMAVTHMPTKEDIKEEHEFKLCPVAVRRTLATMLDISLFKSPCFIIMAVSGFFMMLGLFVPFIYITNRANQAEMDVSVTKFLISAIGIANTVGRLVCGFVSSIQGVSTLWINNTAISLGAIATIISGLSYTSGYQFVYCAIFGVALACFASLRSILVVEFMGLDRLTNSFGLLLLFQGLGASISAPLAGMFYDATGNYDASFYSAGCFMLLSALLCYPLNAISRWEKKKNGISEKEVNVV